MRASRRLHSSPLLNTGYNLAEKKKMMFARFILWDMSGGRQERKQKCGNLGSAEDEVLCLGVRPRIWGRFFARHHAGHFKLAFRVGAGVVLGGAGTLASPWAERCLVMEMLARQGEDENGRLRRPGRKGVSSACDVEFGYAGRRKRPHPSPHHSRPYADENPFPNQLTNNLP